MRAEQSEYARPVDLASAELARFLGNPGHDELAALYHTVLPEDPSGRLHTLQQTAATYWDFRRGAERQATEWNIEGDLGEEGSDAWNTVFTAASKLGMVESSKPANRTPDYLVVLGGANKSPYDRLRYGLESVDDFGIVVYLGSSRRVSDSEREKAQDFAPNAQTEFDLGCGALETHLGARLVSQDRTERHGDVWAWREYEFEVEREKEDGAKVTETKTAFALNTPLEIHTETDKTRRATTYDNYRFFAERAELPQNPAQSVVAVTTGFYVPGQHLPAVQELTLPYGTTVETIGHSAEYSGARRLPTQLLQEDKSAIDAGVRLEQAIAHAEGTA